MKHFLKKHRLNEDQLAIKDRIEAYTENIVMLFVCLFLCIVGVYVMLDAGPEYNTKLTNNILEVAESVVTKIIHLIDFLSTGKQNG